MCLICPYTKIAKMVSLGKTKSWPPELKIDKTSFPAGFHSLFFPSWCFVGSSFPADASHVLLPLLMLHMFFFPCWCFTCSSFPADAPHVLLSLLMLHMFFFPCWCFTLSSFPAGASHGLLSLLMLHSLLSLLMLRKFLTVKLPWQLNKMATFNWHFSSYDTITPTIYLELRC